MRIGMRIGIGIGMAIVTAIAIGTGTGIGIGTAMLARTVGRKQLSSRRLLFAPVRATGSGAPSGDGPRAAHAAGLAGA